MIRWLAGLALLLALALCSGCATVAVLNAQRAAGPLVYAGTRLDWYALQGGCCPVSRFGAQPPDYPAVDLPFSFLLDTLFLPISLAAALGLRLVISGGS